MAETEHAAPAKKGALRRAAGTVGRVAKFAFVGDTSEVREIYVGVRSRIHRLLHPADYAHRETFAQACERLGLTPADVERRRGELHSSARLYAAIAAVSMIVFGLLPWSSHPFNHGLCSLLVLTMALARYSVVRWRQGQCELKELVTYAQYWRSWWSR